jgi:hypothetical protein
MYVYVESLIIGNYIDIVVAIFMYPTEGSPSTLTFEAWF